jgi:hypothetical protein
MKKLILLLLLVFNYSCSYLPPTRELALSNVNFNWAKDSTKHYNYYYESNSITSKYLDSTKYYYEKEFGDLLKYLGVLNYDKKLNLFMVDSNERMEQLIGIKTNGAVNPKDGTVYNLFNQKIQSYGNHEICHIIASSEWGECKDAWIGEGLAVNSDGVWWLYELHSLANYLRNKGKLIPIKELIENFHNYSEIITYPESGSFVKYIKEKYGLDLIKNLYREGAIAFEKKLHKSTSDIEREWLNEIKKYECANIRYEEKAIKYGVKF